MKTREITSLMVVFIVVLLVAIWVFNLSKLMGCDFEYNETANFKCEVVHGLGVLMPPASVLTVWYGVDDD